MSKTKSVFIKGLYVAILILILLVIVKFSQKNKEITETEEGFSSSLSKGAIAGIVIGSLLGVYILRLIIKGLYDGYQQKSTYY
jgi:hypothetical protein